MVAASALRPYAAIVTARFLTLLQYRAAAAAGIGTQLFWGLIRSMILASFYRSSSAPQPMTLPQIITYVWLGQAMLGLLPWNIDPDIALSVRNGTVAYELLRPLDLYSLWYCRAVAQRSAPTLLKCIPQFVVAGLFFGMQPPASWAAGAGWLATTAGAVTVSAAITTLMAVSLLWTVSSDGIVRIIPTLVLVGSGMLIPIALMPHWARVVCAAMPFRDVVDTPFRVYLGLYPAASVPWIVARQLAWAAGLALAGRWLLNRGTRRLVVQGG